MSHSQVTPLTILLDTGKCKYGSRWAFRDGWTATWTVKDAFELKGRRKKTQLRHICAAFGLNVDWVLARDWHIRKSGNLTYHPATYSLVMKG